MARANDLADALIAEGNKAENSGNAGEACEQYRKAGAAAPGYAKAHLNLGIGLEAAGDIDAAVRSYEAALAIDPADAYANYNLGKVLCARRDFDRAENFLRAALDRKPEFPEALVALSNVHDSKGNLADALASIELALKLRPDWVGALYNYAVVLRKLGRPADAETALRQGLAIDPESMPVCGLLTLVLRSQGRFQEALEILAELRERDPDRFDIESVELFTLTCWDGISSEELFARHKAFGSRLEGTHARRIQPFGNSRDPERRLRVGYVSGDFYLHPVAFFAIPLFERHDRSACEIFAYFKGDTVDDFTRQVRARADVWRDGTSLSDLALAEAINRDGIDVLVDLAGHSGISRLAVFAQQPATVQVTWLGYLNTTGLTRMQYRLCDLVTDPQGAAERLHTETLARMPHSQWCYRPYREMELSKTHAMQPPCIRNGHITFGSFNHRLKLSPGVLALW